jgi:DNA ligase-associated metallophosphoesterase
MPINSYPFTLKNEELLLLPEKAIWFPEHKVLLVSDVHLGKGAHFRKSGIPIPKDLSQEDLANLSDLITHYQPQKIIFLGDLFHSDINDDWNWFSLWRQLHQEIEIILIKGNHDIISTALYQRLGIQVVDEMTLGPFVLLHNLPKQQKQEYVLAGHIHPGIKLRGKGRQSLTVACFYFTPGYAILPAFGKFTGKACIEAKEGDTVFAIAGKKVLKFP